MMKYLLALAFVMGASTAQAQTCDPNSSICVPKEDMATITKVLQEQKCLKTTKPTFKLDPLTIVTDQEGRVFYTGSAPKPFTLKMTWCDYEVEGQGGVSIVAAMKEPPTWGFRFRPKAYIGFLLAEPFYASVKKQAVSVSVKDVADAGFMVDFLYWKWINLNVALGYHSFGGGIGFDVTKNFGLYTGYGLTWGTWEHNPNLGAWFGF